MSNLEPNNNLGLDNQTYTNLKVLLANRESGNNQYSENTLGYLGKYQFGAPALLDTGFIDKEKYKAAKKGRGWQKKFLADDSNWTIPGGKQAFMSNVEYQEQAMDNLLAINAKTLRSKIPNKVDTQQSLSSNLAAAHLGGVGSVIKYHKTGESFQDAYGTDIQEYMRLGAKSTSSQEIIPYTPSNKNTTDDKLDELDAKDSKDSDKNSGIFNDIISNPMESALGLAFIGSVFGSAKSKVTEGYASTKEFFSNIKDKFSSKPKEQNDQEANIKEQARSNNIFEALIERIVTSQEQLSTAMNSNKQGGNNLAAILGKIYSVNEDIYRVVKEYAEQAYDEQDTSIRDSNKLEPAQQTQIINNVVQTVSEPSNGFFSNLFNSFLGSAGFLAGVISAVTGYLGSKSIKYLKYIGKLAYKTVKWLFSLSPSKILNSVWSSIKASNIYKLILDTADNVSKLFKLVYDLSAKVTTTAAKATTTALKAAKPLIENAIGKTKSLAETATKIATTTAKNTVAAVKTAAENAKPLVDTAKSKIATTATKVQQAGFLDTVADYAIKAKDAVVEGAGVAWNYTTDKVSIAYNYSKDAIQEGYKYTTTKFKELWGSLSKAAFDGWDKLKQLIPINIIEEKIVPKMLSFLSPIGAKTFLTVLKKVPLLGLAVGSGMAVSRALAGDYTGAALEFLSGIASTIPGPGTAASLAIDGALIYRDLNTTESEAEAKVDDLKKEIELVVNKDPNIESNRTVVPKETPNSFVESNKETKTIIKEQQLNKIETRIVEYNATTPIQPNINIINQQPNDNSGRLSNIFDY
nr:MAG TPA: hypothetical protein [Caudoviricetes sp.]